MPLARCGTDCSSNWHIGQETGSSAPNWKFSRNILAWTFVADLILQIAVNNINWIQYNLVGWWKSKLVRCGLGIIIQALSLLYVHQCHMQKRGLDCDPTTFLSVWTSILSIDQRETNTAGQNYTAWKLYWSTIYSTITTFNFLEMIGLGRFREEWAHSGSAALLALLGRKIQLLVLI